ncbi:dTDP-4-dehydrorhamnose 3,5-epimerase family protein [Amycolatopsis sp. NPDC088138]|uniref:dTDP-4-dehydrorhamnose 3,5-epimerase family protein n=1 Tax=Amycolatopsis sp. NPDC088138 TaxID=3363938 RepID=UPI0037F41C72
MESQIEPLPIAGAWKITAEVFTDHRGSLHEPFHSGQFAEATGVDLVIRQATCSTSHRAVLRGIRVTEASGPAKYVTCLQGSVLDVVVDLRVGSPTFGCWHAERLHHLDRAALYIAPGLGHAFLALSETATVLYLLSQSHEDAHEQTVNSLDPDLAIAWPTDVTPLRSASDAAAPSLFEARQARTLPIYATCVSLHGKAFPQFA